MLIKCQFILSRSMEPRVSKESKAPEEIQTGKKGKNYL
jgi:hypothetical protein